MWKQIKEAPRYEINAEGTVRNIRTKHILKKQINAKGYWVITLHIGPERNHKKSFLLHRLIAEAFIPNPENKPWVNHKNGNTLNYQLNNLEWATPSENQQHAYDTGLKTPSHKSKNQGTQNARSKLTEKQILWARQNYKPNDKTYGVRPMARYLKIDSSLLSKIIQGKRWKHI
jgi:hypothetical protein